MNEWTKAWLKASGITLSALAIFAGVGIYEELYDKPVPKPHQYCLMWSGLIWSDEHKREYAGMSRNFREGTEQKIYVDRKPFGSLDGVRLEQYVNGQKNVLEERKPEINEEDTFLILQERAKLELPHRFKD